MKSALEDLAIVIAEQNHILKEESSLYQRLVTDYKEYSKQLSEFWLFYFDKYKNNISEGDQMTVNYKTSELLKVPVGDSCHSHKKTIKLD